MFTIEEKIKSLETETMALLIFLIAFTLYYMHCIYFFAFSEITVLSAIITEFSKVPHIHESSSTFRLFQVQSTRINKKILTSKSYKVKTTFYDLCARDVTGLITLRFIPWKKKRF